MGEVMKDTAREDRSALQALVRAMLRTAALPATTPQSVWAGPGSGSMCAICAQPIAANGFEVELVFHEGGAPRGMRLHCQCHAIWEMERRWFC
jgi:hypothetical protein